MKSKTMLLMLTSVLLVCTSIQAQVLYETDFLGDDAIADWVTTDNAWAHDPAAGTFTVSGAAAASAAYYSKIELADYTVTADVEVNNSAAAVVARFTSLSDPFYMCRYHPQNAILQLYLINPTTLLASLALAEMPDLDPAQTYAVSVTVQGNSVIGSLIQSDTEYSIEATDETATSGFGGMRVWGGGENVFGRFAILGLSKASAAGPVPADGGTDVPRQVVLSWTAGEFAVKHDVYLGTVFDDVNDATVPSASGLDVNSFDPGRLEFGKTYYWRVDEVNGTPDQTVFKGNVWSFTAEPYSIEIPGDTITVTASSSSNEFSIPDKTIDGSGLDANDMHASAAETMWFTAVVDLDPWIQYEFDDVLKLDIMTVWNSNGAAESAIGWGVKEVQIEYSVDGENWDVLAGATQFSRAPGLPTYSQADEIAFNGAAAKYVRLNIQSNWGGILMSYGLSEVQFSMIPAAARTPGPVSGSVDVLPTAMLQWRAGREADQHTIYVGTDQNAVTDGTAPSVTSSTNSLDLTSLDLELSQTYYWRVDEVNETEVPSVWAGPVWNFSTVPYLTIDDFESYGNFSPDRPFQTWLDGIGYSTDEFFPVAYEGNGTGAAVGHDIWSVASSHYNGTIMETTIVYGGLQSLPLYYTNTGSVASETQRKFAVPQDWTAGGIKRLSLAVQGEAGNTGQLYLKINNAKVVAERVAIDAAQWQMWTIDLATVGVNLNSVTTLTVGIEGSGASGKLYLDDIRLYPTVSTGIDIGSERTMLNNGGTLASQWIRSDNPEDVKGGAMFVGGLPSGADLRGILAFSLAALKPGDVIGGVTISLFHGNNGTSNHRDGSITSSSLELAGVTNSAYANDRASWNNADQDTPIAWNTAGGDLSESLATVTSLDLTTIDTDDEVAFSSTALTAAVQAAVDAGDSRIAFVLRSPELEASTTRNFFVFQGATASGSGSPIGPNLHIALE
jgi:hypothetical protein